MVTIESLFLILKVTLQFHPLTVRHGAPDAEATFALLCSWCTILTHGCLYR